MLIVSLNYCGTRKSGTHSSGSHNIARACCREKSYIGLGFREWRACNLLALRTIVPMVLVPPQRLLLPVALQLPLFEQTPQSGLGDVEPEARVGLPSEAGHRNVLAKDYPRIELLTGHIVDDGSGGSYDDKHLPATQNLYQLRCWRFGFMLAGQRTCWHRKLHQKGEVRRERRRQSSGGGGIEFEWHGWLS